MHVRVETWARGRVASRHGHDTEGMLIRNYCLDFPLIGWRVFRVAPTKTTEAASSQRRCGLNSSHAVPTREGVHEDPT